MVSKFLLFPAPSDFGFVFDFCSSFGFFFTNPVLPSFSNHLFFSAPASLCTLSFLLESSSYGLFGILFTFSFPRSWLYESARGLGSPSSWASYFLFSRRLSISLNTVYS